MFIATAIISALFAAILVFSAVGKLQKAPAQMESMRTVRFPEDKVSLLAAAEIAGAVGLLVGLIWWPIGVAAAVGTALYFIGAVIAHLRVGDRTILPAAVLLGISVIIIALRVLSA